MTTINIDDKIKQLNQLEDEKKKGTSKNVDIYNFIDTFNVLSVTVGTIIGYSLNNVIQEFTKDALLPIVMSQFNIRTLHFFGIPLNGEQIVGNILYLLFIIIIVVLIFKYVLLGITGKIINEHDIII